jgi:diguanylate cyclase (GGDEF)-like protein
MQDTDTSAKHSSSMATSVPTVTTEVPTPEERRRLQALAEYDILDTPPEVIFDELARIAASICETPIALVSLIDGRRQWFKAKVGLEATETPREFAFCAHAIHGVEPFIVPNTLEDPRFATNPLVTSDPAIRFYAGAPLITPDGQALGTLCVIDRVPRELSPDRIEALQLLSRHVVAQLELRKRVSELSRTNVRRGLQIGDLQQTRARLDGLIQEQGVKLTNLAQYSAQTGLANRALFLTRLQEQLQAAAPQIAPVTVFVLDMQRFAFVSETLGQSHLDEFLRQVAHRLMKIFPRGEQIAHLEADRFAAFTPAAPSVQEAAALLDGQLLPALSAPYTIEDQELRVAFKVGIAIATPEDRSAELILRRAKAALLKAKESEEAYAVFSADLEKRVANVISLETKLRRALEQQQFELHYQPKVSLIDGTVTGVEALLRWRDPSPESPTDDPSNLWVPPARFIPALESTGLILEVGRWALTQAAHDHRDWQSRGVAAPRIAVNISPLQLRHRHFLREFREILDTPGPAPGIDVELTEAMLMEQPEQCIQSLQTLRQWGIKVAIDDFGSGYSSLRYIARLPIDALKIDMAFVHAMTKEADNMAIVSTVISLAHGLRLKTIAEGVETEEQRNLLRLLRCDEMQGYLFSKPLSKRALETLLLGNAAKA